MAYIMHWLPIKYRIKFKILTVVFHALNDMAPSYIRELLVIDQPTRMTRSSVSAIENSYIKLKPQFMRKKTFADWSFSVVGPQLWNDLPVSLKT